MLRMIKCLIKFFRAPLVLEYTEEDGRHEKAMEMAVVIEAKLNRHVIIAPAGFIKVSVSV